MPTCSSSKLTGCQKPRLSPLCIPSAHWHDLRNPAAAAWMGPFDGVAEGLSGVGWHRILLLTALSNLQPDLNKHFLEKNHSLVWVLHLTTLQRDQDSAPPEPALDGLHSRYWFELNDENTSAKMRLVGTVGERKKRYFPLPILAFLAGALYIRLTKVGLTREKQVY